jgi:hypothetical protein
MTVTATESSQTSGLEEGTTRDGTRASPSRRRPSRGEQVLVWTFGILELFIDLASESVNLTRDRVRFIHQVTSGEGRTDSMSRPELP